MALMQVMKLGFLKGVGYYREKREKVLEILNEGAIIIPNEAKDNKVKLFNNKDKKLARGKVCDINNI